MNIRIQKNNEALGLGHLGPARAGETYKVTARVPMNVLGLNISRDKLITPRRDLALETSTFRRFVQRVTVVHDQDGRPTTMYGSNALTLMAWDHPTFALHTIAVVVDGGEVYAVLSTDGFTAYNQAGPIVPALPRWKWEPGLLEEIVGSEHIGHLPPATEYKEEPERITGLGIKQGFVRWWNDAMGRGLIATREGDAMVMRDHLVRLAPHRLRRLDRGTIVTYDRLFEIESECRGSVTLGAYCVRALPIEQALAANG